MTGIVGLFVCPSFTCILVVMLGYAARYGLIFLVWHWCVAMSRISIYQCIGTAWATFKFEPHSNCQAIGEVEGTSQGYHFVPLYLGWFRGVFNRLVSGGNKQHGIKHYIP